MMVEELAARGFEIHCVSHATAILTGDSPDLIAELEQSLLEVEGFYPVSTDDLINA
jgi:hypothetical protein